MIYLDVNYFLLLIVALEVILKSYIDGFWSLVIYPIINFIWISPPLLLFHLRLYRFKDFHFQKLPFSQVILTFKVQF